jgi:ABC-type lipoprotein release transport system permease subunit
MRTLYEVSIVLVLVACLATMIPARRALAVDPAETLRAE